MLRRTKSSALNNHRRVSASVWQRPQQAQTHHASQYARATNQKYRYAGFLVNFPAFNMLDQEQAPADCV
jgi:hypothetical protein